MLLETTVATTTTTEAAPLPMLHATSCDKDLLRMVWVENRESFGTVVTFRLTSMSDLTIYDSLNTAGTVDSASALRHVVTLVLRVRATPPAPRPA
ncbi:hypothetical protein PoB_003552400 [Plakobranchus ocellatus]|uniref:Uncharacterized protein n=1 Tax=Plakobranchus ocellatus TaxID=259542 RepID=A0AAV4AML4_9GAST|nr:hypothetical protein PoB_003552400 [Plakobranchus ocellatus]